MTDHFTAWLTNDVSALETDYMDITVLRDELISGDPDDPRAWAATTEQAFYAVTTVNAKDGDIDAAQSEAKELLANGGWRIVGDWDATPNAYTATVARD